MIKKVITGILIIVVIVIGAGAWYYFSQVRKTPIAKILSGPKEYEGKVVTIEGDITDRTAFFVVVKFFKVRDKTGEIIVVTKKSLPEVKSIVRVKGRIDDAFPIGDQKLLVFMEESIEKKEDNLPKK